MSTFSAPWRTLPGASNATELEPVLEVFLFGPNGTPHREFFVVDSGAHSSMAPRRLCDLLGYDWSLGTPTTLYGIAPRKECQVQAMMHPVDMLIREIGYQLTILVCFAEGDAPLLLGRDGLFDAFRVQFDKPRLQTTFELI